MMTMASIAELRAAGATFEADEAVAIAQQLIRTLGIRHDADRGQPLGPPSEGNVFLNEDGSVSCRGCGTTPTVSQVGIFLHALLPAGSAHVPGSLRHTIACALHNINADVDAQPSDSLKAFSRSLAGHEHGVRADVVRGVLARSSGDHARRPLTRRHAASPRRLMVMAAAACLVVGLSVLASGEVMHGAPAQIVATRTVPVAAAITMAGTPRVDVRRLSMVRTLAPRVTRVAAAMPAAMFVGPQPDAREPSRGMLDKLHLGWLRTKFVIRNDL